MEGEEPSGPWNPDAYRVHTARMTLPDTLTIDETMDAVKVQTRGPVKLLHVHLVAPGRGELR